MVKPGKIYGIGVGPGDPELLTIKARRILKEVPLLLVPRSRRDKDSLALSIVEEFLREDLERVDLLLPMTRDRDELKKHWERAARQVLEKLQKGKDGAFITLGDPATYSTFPYLQRHLWELDREVEVEMIPGVSAINDMASRVGCPLAEGEESLAITTPPKTPGDLEEILDRFENLVIMKAGRSTGEITSLLESKGLEGRAFFASRIGFADGFYTRDLSELKDKTFDYLSTFIIKFGLHKG